MADKRFKLFFENSSQAYQFPVTNFFAELDFSL